MCGIEIRSIESFEDYERCADLQKLIWKFEDRDLLPPRLYKLYSFLGGNVLGAFTGKENRLIGFTLAQPSFHAGIPSWHSNLLAVHPDFQNGGVGWRMKQAQRQDALKTGIRRITWTFDPLQARNAYFNLNRLGACVRSYIRNAYGPGSSSAVHGRLGTDRVLAEWDLDHPGVVARMEGAPDSVRALPAAELPPVLLQWRAHRKSPCLDARLPDRALHRFCLEIPGDFSGLLQSNILLAREWRRKFRVLLMSAFSMGFEMNRVVRIPGEETSGPLSNSWRTFFILESC